MDKIILRNFWAGHGETKTEAMYYRGERKLGREVVESKAEAISLAEGLYGFDIETTEVEEV